MSIELSCPGIAATPQGKELVQHGTALFPLACYNENMALYGVPWHWHEDFEYILAAEGRVTVGVEKNRLCLAEGQGVLVNSGVLHAVEFAEAGPSVLHSGVFHPRLIGGRDTVFWQKYAAPLLAPGAPSYILLDGSAPWHAEALDALRASWQAMAEESPGFEIRARFCLTSALRLCCLNLPAASAEPSPQEQLAAERVKQMLHFIEENYAGEVSVAAVAASAAVSESTCVRSFHQFLGASPIQYVKQYRIERAAQLLLSTRRKACDIGAACGFADVSYFTRTFREMKGCTPSEYRKKFV